MKELTKFSAGGNVFALVPKIVERCLKLPKWQIIADRKNQRTVNSQPIQCLIIGRLRRCITAIADPPDRSAWHRAPAPGGHSLRVSEKYC